MSIDLKTLKDVCENISRPFDFSRFEKVVFINTGDVLDGNFLHEEFSEKKGLPGQAKKAIQKNDILFSEIRPINKRFAFVDKDCDEYVVSTKFMVLRSKGDVLPKYLYHYLKCDTTIKNLQKEAESRSGTFPQITFDSVSYLPIPIPSLDYQERITSLIDEIEEKIELNQKMNETLEEIAKTLFKSWFIDFDPVRAKAEGRPTGLSKEISDLFPDSFEDSELGEIPKGWQINNLGSVISFLGSGKRPKGGASISGNQIPSIGAENINFLGKYNYSKEKYIPYEFYKKLKKKNIAIRDYDVLIYKDGANIGRSTIFGKGFPHKECTINEHVHLLRINRVTQKYLYFYLSTREIQQELILLNTTSAQPGINQTSLKSLNILNPANKVLEQFDEFVTPLVDSIFRNCLENNTLSELRDTLSPKLISGELKIPDAKKLVDEVDI